MQKSIKKTSSFRGMKVKLTPLIYYFKNSTKWRAQSNLRKRKKRTKNSIKTLMFWSESQVVLLYRSTLKIPALSTIGNMISATSFLQPVPNPIWCSQTLAMQGCLLKNIILQTLIIQVGKTRQLILQMLLSKNCTLISKKRKNLQSIV